MCIWQLFALLSLAFGLLLWGSSRHVSAAWRRHIAARKKKLAALAGVDSLKRNKYSDDEEEEEEMSAPPTIFGFFHPFCDGGGGGERVLWTAIKAIQQRTQNSICVVYSADRIKDLVKDDKQDLKEKLLDKIKGQFDISIDPARLAIKSLKTWKLLEAKRYKRLTLIGQSLGSILVVWEGMHTLIPDVYIDTIGFAFPYPLIRQVYGVKVAAYVHYPTISSDMLGVVEKGTESFNNSGAVAKNVFFRQAKFIYYQLFSALYGYVGRSADVVMANSSWTLGHLNDIWRIPQKTCVVYPPCDTKALTQFPLLPRERLVLSVAQFRPEKAHLMQLKALQKLLADHPEHKEGSEKLYLVLVGGCRNAGDQAIVDSLRVACKDMDLENNVRFIVNAPYPDLISQLSRALVGIHTMINEHFGIGVVEYMAAGLIPLAHDSAGPKMDIVTASEDCEKRTGFLATSVEEYADNLYKALHLPQFESVSLRQRARQSVATKFSAEAFESGFLTAIQPTYE